MRHACRGPCSAQRLRGTFWRPQARLQPRCSASRPAIPHPCPYPHLVCCWGAEILTHQQGMQLLYPTVGKGERQKRRGARAVGAAALQASQAPVRAQELDLEVRQTSGQGGTSFALRSHRPAGALVQSELCRPQHCNQLGQWVSGSDAAPRCELAALPALPLPSTSTAQRRRATLFYRRLLANAASFIRPGNADGGVK